MSDNTEPTHDELEAIFHTENGMSLLAIWRAGRVAGLEEAATIATESQRRIYGIGTDGYTSYITEAVWPHAGIEIARAIRARLGDTGNQEEH